MNKSNPMSSAPMDPAFPSAPPSYEEAVLKQPAYNPHIPYHPPMATMQPVHMAPPMQPQPQAAPVVTVLSVGPTPAGIVCPHCQKRIRTRVYTSVQKSAHVAAIVLCILGCWLCSCIPYCLSSFQDVHHKCPECKTYIATYKH